MKAKDYIYISDKLNNIDNSAFCSNKYMNNLTSYNIDCMKINLLVKIILCKNNLHIINNFLFNSLEHLKVLDLRQNRIHFILTYSLVGLIKLEYLNLSKNKIVQIHYFLFNDLHNAFNIDISGNLIDEILIKFSNIENDIPLNNSLKLDDTLVLNLSRNKITLLPFTFVKNIMNIYLLDISYNCIKMIKSNTLHILLNLKRINLSNNKIRHFNLEFISNDYNEYEYEYRV